VCVSVARTGEGLLELFALEEEFVRGKYIRCQTPALRRSRGARRVNEQKLGFEVVQSRDAMRAKTGRWWLDDSGMVGRSFLGKAAFRCLRELRELVAAFLARRACPRYLESPGGRGWACLPCLPCGFYGSSVG
jgi:hypothetical protein